MLRRGGLVAFPTETVYGLGANALSERAVKSIYTAKGRPSDNPLIVHVGHLAQVRELTTAVGPEADLLMKRFWPGPLTLVLPSAARVAPAISAGLGTVAVRMPRHPVALAMLRRARLPVAAPSANLSGRPSPTVGRHVLQDLGGRIDLILDAGSVQVGVESTVLDLTVKPAVILRPGGITMEEISGTIGKVTVDPAVQEIPPPELVPRAPGMKYRHYAPRAPLFLVKGEPLGAADKIVELALDAVTRNCRVVILASSETEGYYRDRVPEAIVLVLGPHSDPARAAARVYTSLKTCDSLGAGIIFSECWPESGLGMALMNRLRKAAAYQVIHA